MSYAFSLTKPDINNLDDFTEYICGRLQKEFRIEDKDTSQNSWERRLRNCLLAAAESKITQDTTGRVYLAIDGLEECPDYQKLLNTLPRSNKIAYLLFTQPDIVQINDEQNFYKKHLPLLTQETAEQILKDRLDEKWSIAQPIAAKLLSHEENLTPLILTEFAEEFIKRPNTDSVWWEDICGLKSYFKKRIGVFDAVTCRLLGALASALEEGLTSETLEKFVEKNHSGFSKCMEAANRFVKYTPDAGCFEYRHNAWKTYACDEFTQDGKDFALWSGINAATGTIDDNGYSLRHGVQHLIKKGEWGKAGELLTNFDYLMRRLKEKGGQVDPILSEYEEVARNYKGSAFKDWLGFFREKGHMLRRGNKEWGAERILYQLAWEDGEDSELSFAADQYTKNGKATWKRLLATRPKNKNRSNCLVLLELQCIPMTMSLLTS